MRVLKSIEKLAVSNNKMPYNEAQTPSLRHLMRMAKQRNSHSSKIFFISSSSKLNSWKRNMLKDSRPSTEVAAWETAVSFIDFFREKIDTFSPYLVKIKFMLLE